MKLNRLELKPLAPVGKLAKLPKPVAIRKALDSVPNAPDPIKGKVDYTGDIEADAAAELGAVEIGFRERMKEEAERFKGATGSDFYFVAVFDDGDQATAFLKGAGFTGGGDLFIDGRKLADAMGIELPASQVTARKIGKPDAKLVRLAGIPRK
jgi:hypothetical protein